MRKFLSVILFLGGTVLLLYAFPQTRALLPIGGSSTTGRIALDDSLKIAALVGGGISWLFACILQIQDMQLKKMEIADKKVAQKNVKKTNKK